MDKKVIDFLKKPVYPYTLALWFLVFKSAECFVSFNPFLFIVFTGALFAGIFASVWFLLRITKINCARIIVSLSLLLLFFIEPITASLRSLFFICHLSFNYYYYIFIAAVLIALSYGWNGIMSDRSAYKNLAANIFLLLFCFTSISQGIRVYSKAYPVIHNRSLIGSLPASMPSRDIVWILMDEYASSASLKSEFGFNDPLDTFLEKRDYLLLDSIRTRSTVTLYSVNSIFNLDDSVLPVNYAYGQCSLANCLWTKQLSAEGYSLENLDFMNIGGAEGIARLDFFPQSYSDQVFYNTIINMVENLIEYHRKNVDSYNQSVLRRLGEALALKSTHPRFIWAHFLIPHLPYFRNSKGELLPNPQKIIEEEGPTKARYIDYVSYGNEVIENLINTYPDLNNKIVLISADHGARFPFMHDKEEPFRPYAAIHFPVGLDTSLARQVRYIQQLPVFIETATHK